MVPSVGAGGHQGCLLPNCGQPGRRSCVGIAPEDARPSGRPPALSRASLINSLLPVECDRSRLFGDISCGTEGGVDASCSDRLTARLRKDGPCRPCVCGTSELHSGDTRRARVGSGSFPARTWQETQGHLHLHGAVSTVPARSPASGSRELSAPLFAPRGRSASRPVCSLEALVTAAALAGSLAEPAPRSGSRGCCEHVPRGSRILGVSWLSRATWGTSPAQPSVGPRQPVLCDRRPSSLGRKMPAYQSITIKLGLMPKNVTISTKV